MKNISYNKGIVFGTIVVLLLTVPSSLATFNLHTVETLNNNKSDGKPDLVIQDVTFQTQYLLWNSCAVVINKGNANVPDKHIELRGVSFKPLTRRMYGEYQNRFRMANMKPGETRDVCSFSPNPSGWGKMKVYFMVDADNNIDESNENNNVVWAYVKYPPLGMTPVVLTFWHQVSKIPDLAPNLKTQLQFRKFL